MSWTGVILFDFYFYAILTTEALWCHVIIISSRGTDTWAHVTHSLGEFRGTNSCRENLISDFLMYGIWFIFSTKLQFPCPRMKLNSELLLNVIQTGFPFCSFMCVFHLLWPRP